MSLPLENRCRHRNCNLYFHNQSEVIRHTEEIHTVEWKLYTPDPGPPCPTKLVEPLIRMHLRKSPMTKDLIAAQPLLLHPEEEFLVEGGFQLIDQNTREFVRSERKYLTENEYSVMNHPCVPMSVILKNMANCTDVTDHLKGSVINPVVDTYNLSYLSYPPQTVLETTKESNSGPIVLKATQENNSQPIVLETAKEKNSEPTVLETTEANNSKPITFEAIKKDNFGPIDSETTKENNSGSIISETTKENNSEPIVLEATKKNSSGRKALEAIRLRNFEPIVWEVAEKLFVPEFSHNVPQIKNDLDATILGKTVAGVIPEKLRKRKYPTVDKSLSAEGAQTAQDWSFLIERNFNIYKTDILLRAQQFDYYHKDYIVKLSISGAKQNYAGDPEDRYPYICPVPGCLKAYKNPNGIRYHANTAHKGAPRLNCDICGSVCKTAQGLMSHLNRHEEASLKIKTTPVKRRRKQSLTMTVKPTNPPLKNKFKLNRNRTRADWEHGKIKTPAKVKTRASACKDPSINHFLQPED